ncbi:MAG: PD-(D/E)XK nuclease family protein [Pseudomonadota bacterium]
MKGVPIGSVPAAVVFFEQIAQVILAAHAPPDLRGVVVILPNYHAAQPLAQALMTQAGASILLLPQMVTLNDWAQTVPLVASPVSDDQRLTALYHALRSRNWFPDAERWGLARELLDLLDELTAHRVVLPQDEIEFAEQLEAAYRARNNAPMQFEARVVHELWYAMQGDGELCAVAAYQQRLARLAEQANAPLYVLQVSALALPEVRFLERYAECAPVTYFDLREMAAEQPVGAFLRAGCEAGNEVEAFSQTAERIVGCFPVSPVQDRLILFAAQSLEQEAQAAELQVRRWLLAGKRNIALVAQDRMVARRVRARLERAEVLVRDETGWTFSTLAVSAVLMRWLEALQSDFYHQDMLDLLKSPFIFADMPVNERKEALYQLEKLVRERNVVAHLAEFIELAGRDADLQRPLLRLQRAAQCLQKRSDTLEGWLSRLYESLDILGVLPGLAADAAGQQLLHHLHQWQETLAGETARFSRAEWRAWLALQLDRMTFRDTDIDSPVSITHLAATRWRQFDAVLLLGCDAAHLPALATGGQWFNDAVRSALELPTGTVRLAQQRDDLLGLLTLNDCVLATWQASRNGEPNLLSPYLELLRALHRLAYKADLLDSELAELLPTAQVRPPPAPLPQIQPPPAPTVAPDVLPTRISPSGYNRLVACPYQFFARYVLRLDELEEVREATDKRDYGVWVHAVLQRFHQAYPQVAGHAREELERTLRQISAAVFDEALEHDYLAHAWLLRWQARIAEYLDWQVRNEAEGWHFVASEQPFELTLDGVTLHGRVDRLDRQADGAVRVLDYKTKPLNALKTVLSEPGEDVQLACYAAACHAGAAAFVSVEKPRIGDVAPEQEMDELAAANMQRLQDLFAQMRAAAPLPANGVESACAYCEMRGLCRKNFWGEQHG